MKTRPIQPSRICGTVCCDSDFGNRQPLLPIEEKPQARSVREQGRIIVARLIKRGWDCHSSLPRNHCYLLNCPKFGGYDCVLFWRGGDWQLKRKKR